MGSRILTLLSVKFEEVMRALAFAVGLWCSSLVSCGIIKDSEDLSLEAIENASLDGYATIAQLTDEELKIVSLLERIQEKFVTLDEGEKVEFVRKISDYKDRFTSTLDKVENIPGMYKLNVTMLRTNLGIPGPSDTLEEIHDPRDYEEVKLPDATVEIVPDIEATVSYEEKDVPLARAAVDPIRPTVSKPVAVKPERSLNDIYKVMTQLVQLVLYQIAQEFKKPDAVPARSVYPYYPTPSVSMRAYSPYSNMHVMAKKSKSKKLRPSVRPTPPMYGRQSPYHEDLAGMLNAIPPSYDDVSIHYDYPYGPSHFPNKRHRRDTNDDVDDDDEAVIDVVDDGEEEHSEIDSEAIALQVLADYGLDAITDDADDVEEEHSEIDAEAIARQVLADYALDAITNDADDGEEEQSEIDADIEAEAIARQVAAEYALWYEQTYTPWREALLRSQEEEERNSYVPWWLHEEEEDDESDELEEEHEEAVEQLALYKALMLNVVGDDENEASDDQNNDGEEDDQEVLENFNQAMQQLREQYQAMLEAGEEV